MSEFIPKTTDNLGNPDADNQAEDAKDFTPKKQDIDSQSDSGKEPNNPAFKKLLSENLPDAGPSGAKPLKNIQVPGGKTENLDKKTAGTENHSKVNVVRNGDKITKIIVECNCGETIPLDCIY